LSEATKTFTMLLAGIAAISLLVGGIGIMNIMLVSVTERTREIGVRKALGARRRDIMLQFLVEALVLCLAGGALGIALGVGAARMTERMLSWSVAVAPAAVFLAFGFAGAVGVFFGIWPARRAARLDPLISLRYEQRADRARASVTLCPHRRRTQRPGVQPASHATRHSRTARTPSAGDGAVLLDQPSSRPAPACRDGLSQGALHPAPHTHRPVATALAAPRTLLHALLLPGFHQLVPLRTLLVGKYGSRCPRRRTRLLAHCLHLGAHRLTLLGGHLGATLAHLRAQLSPLLRRHLLTALLHLRASCGALLRRELRPLRHVLLHPGACRRELLLLLIANCFQLRDLVGSELQGLPFREHGRGYTTAHAHALTGRVLWLLCLRVQRRQHQCQRYDILSHRVLP